MIKQPDPDLFQNTEKRTLYKIPLLQHDLFLSPSPDSPSIHSILASLDDLLALSGSRLISINYDSFQPLSMSISVVASKPAKDFLQSTLSPKPSKPHPHLEKVPF